MKIPRQCAILVGGFGTRLGHLTANTPKPLLDCGGRPFLTWVLRELSRFGIEEVILLAGFRSEQVGRYCRDVVRVLPKPMEIGISVEPEPAGTGGALWHARELLDESFLLINGDSWIDTNLAALFSVAAQQNGAMGCMLLRQMDDCSRYGLVEIEGNRVVFFREKPGIKIAGTINGGMFVLDRAILQHITPKCSLEQDVLPQLLRAGALFAMVADDYFIDIGIPADYERASRELPERLLRPAVFFDRDGVLNHDLGWVGQRERFHWMDGAVDAVRRVNGAGYHAFIVTNQAGVARGFYAEEDIAALHQMIDLDLRMVGGSIDDMRYCPYHPDAVVERYRQHSDWRKPGAGMLLDLMQKWEVRRDRSFLVGDRESDMGAARAAGIPGRMFVGGDLDACVEKCLEDIAGQAVT